ncbi:hypothetical protein HYS47_01890 [Candidatus Woesearchaeota archaeon]|nr:hypothetical protein [Candidatus Woesearchaeota archaeon]
MSDEQRTRAVAVIDYPALSTFVISGQDQALIATVHAKVAAAHDYLGARLWVVEPYREELDRLREADQGKHGELTEAARKAALQAYRKAHPLLSLQGAYVRARNFIRRRGVAYDQPEPVTSHKRKVLERLVKEADNAIAQYDRLREAPVLLERVLTRIAAGEATSEGIDKRLAELAQEAATYDQRIENIETFWLARLRNYDKLPETDKEQLQRDYDHAVLAKKPDDETNNGTRAFSSAMGEGSIPKTSLANQHVRQVLCDNHFYVKQQELKAARERVRTEVELLRYQKESVTKTLGRSLMYRDGARKLSLPSIVRMGKVLTRIDQLLVGIQDGIPLQEMAEALESDVMEEQETNRVIEELDKDIANGVAASLEIYETQNSGALTPEQRLAAKIAEKT